MTAIILIISWFLRRKVISPFNRLAKQIKKSIPGGVIVVPVDTGITDKQGENNEIERVARFISKREGQTDASITRSHGGTGLGLAISKQIVGLMSGKIGVTSEVNRGSDFNFTINVPKVAAIEIAATTAEVVNPQNISVLLVKANIVTQKIIFKMLKTLGISPAVATNGVEATHLATSNQYDIIFMDLVMPEMDGRESSWNLVSRTSWKNH